MDTGPIHLTAIIIPRAPLGFNPHCIMKVLPGGGSQSSILWTPDLTLVRAKQLTGAFGLLTRTYYLQANTTTTTTTTTTPSITSTAIEAGSAATITRTVPGRTGSTRFANYGGSELWTAMGGILIPIPFPSLGDKGKTSQFVQDLIVSDKHQGLHCFQHLGRPDHHEHLKKVW